MTRHPDLDLSRSLVLVGMMGAGKTTIGRRLAARLKLEFVDADDEIEAAAGCAIEDIFATHGEAVFRSGEKRVIKRLLDEKVRVLATGGGAFNDADTRQRIQSKAISIWLRADVGLLYKRVSRRNNRPLLKQGDMRATLERLVAERHPIYELADITIDARDGPPEYTVDGVVDALRNYIVNQGAQAGSAP